MSRTKTPTSRTPSHLAETEPRGVGNAVALIVAGLLVGVVSLAAAPADASATPITHATTLR